MRHSDVDYANLDLRLSSRHEIPEPRTEDLTIFRDLIDACRSAGADITASALHKHLPRKLKGNKAEKDVLVSILGLTGILSTSQHPGFARTFVPASARALPNQRFVEMSYPACWWTGAAGIDETALAYFFGHIG